MNIRLVAYRKQLSTSSEELAYELDLQEAPNVSLNFQFSDIKEPETRKASYSQTFKLPFTNKNNDFFQNWYDVNLETLVFSASKKFTAVLYVGTVPQFEGYLRLQSVYKKGEYYEAVLISNTADLFSVIGTKKLKDAYKTETSGVYSEELNHTYNNTNIALSWDGSVNTFLNTLGDSLQDSDAGVQKIVYPISATMDKFFYTEGSNQFLNMSTSLDADYMVNINQLRPAIQIKTLLKKILAKAGLSYTSTFIDSDYFGRLFMTTGNTLEEPVLPTFETMSAIQGGTLDVKRSAYDSSGFMSLNPGFCYTLNNNGVQYVEADIQTADVADVWDTNTNTFHQISPTMQELTIEGNCRRRGIVTCNGSNSPTADPINVLVTTHETDAAGVDTGNILYYGTITNLTGTNDTGSQNYQGWSHIIPLDVANVGKRFRIQLTVGQVETTNFGTQAWFQLHRGPMPIGGVTYFGRVSCTWLDYTPGQYNGTIDIPACIDPDITQKDFLKDIIERFNLVVIADPNNSSNLIIETFDKYLNTGSLKEWTHKLDLSKEILVKDTTSLQKRIINLTDKEDVDLMNKTIKEEIPALNVYGKYYNDKSDNEFATGEFKNSPLFAPYINQQVYKNQDIQDGTDLPSVAMQYEIGYKQVDFGYEAELKATKPKLFYYSGTPTQINNTNGTQVNIYLHHINPSNGTLTAYSFNTYPLCTAWNISSASATGIYTLTSSNQSLYWDFAPPVAPDLTVFNYTQTSDTWEGNSLYSYYWKNYLNTIYNEEGRIMEAYFDLNGIDIFNFKFNDEIFIKDSYWRVLNIHNYQVGEKATTKVTLIKIIDSLVYAPNVAYIPVGSLGGVFILFCPTDDPGCTPSLVPPTFTGLLADEASCYAAGGEPFTGYNSGGLFPCLGNVGSLPANFLSQKSPNAVIGYGQLRTLIAGKLNGKNMPLIYGVDTSKYTQKILPYYGDDVVIKFESQPTAGPIVKGESHRLVLSGYQEGTVRGYAYPEGKDGSKKIIIPPYSNIMIDVKGVSTVVGGSSTTHPVGDTEAFNYHTMFVSKGGAVSQIGTAGGILQWAIKAGSVTSSLHIDTTDNVLEFGLDSTVADAKKSFVLNVEILVQQIPSIALPHDANWALFQNYNNITLQDEQWLIWN